MTLNVANDKAEIDSYGFLRIPTVLASESVLDYYDSEGNVRKVYMPASVIKDAINQFNGIVLTNDHPKCKLVTPENYKKLAVGYIGGVMSFDKGRLRGTCVVCEDQAIEAVSNGKTDVSLGYTKAEIKQAGVFYDEHGTMGEPGNSYPYDFIRTKIDLNHLALVDEGRSLAAHLVLDSVDYTLDVKQVVLDSQDFKPLIHNRNITMTEKNTTAIAVGDKVADVANDSIGVIQDMMSAYKKMKEENDMLRSSMDQLMQEHDSMRKSADGYRADMEGRYSSMDSKNSELQAEVDGLKAAIEQEKSAANDAKEGIGSEIEKRFKTWQSIGGLDNKVVPFDAALDCVGIKRAYLKAVNKDNAEMTTTLDSADSGFIQGMFYGVDLKVSNKVSNLIENNKGTANDAAGSSSQQKGYGQAADGSFKFSGFGRRK